MYIYKYMYIHILIYTGCPRRNGQNFGRVFLMLNYTDITQNTCQTPIKHKANISEPLRTISVKYSFILPDDGSHTIRNMSE